jgi:hypothetical protein
VTQVGHCVTGTDLAVVVVVVPVPSQSQDLVGLESLKSGVKCDLLRRSVKFFNAFLRPSTYLCTFGSFGARLVKSLMTVSYALTMVCAHGGSGVS